MLLCQDGHKDSLPSINIVEPGRKQSGVHSLNVAFLGGKRIVLHPPCCCVRKKTFTVFNLYLLLCPRETNHIVLSIHFVVSGGTQRQSSDHPCCCARRDPKTGFRSSILLCQEGNKDSLTSVQFSLQWAYSVPFLHAVGPRAELPLDSHFQCLLIIMCSSELCKIPV